MRILSLTTFLWLAVSIMAPPLTAADVVFSAPLEYLSPGLFLDVDVRRVETLYNGTALTLTPSDDLADSQLLCNIAESATPVLTSAGVTAAFSESRALYIGVTENVRHWQAGKRADRGS